MCHLGGTDQALNTHKHTKCKRSSRTFTSQRHMKANGASSREELCFFKVRILKRCFIKLAFSHFTVYAIKEPHLSHFQGKISFNSQLTEDNLLSVKREQNLPSSFQLRLRYLFLKLNFNNNLFLQKEVKHHHIKLWISSQ